MAAGAWPPALPPRSPRWVFARPGPGLAALARAIRTPHHLLKLCGTADALAALLPDRWRVAETGVFMRGPAVRAAPRPIAGYAIEMRRHGNVAAATIRASDGTIAASGYAARSHGAFVYDRIETAPAHRRRGLATMLLAALRSANGPAGTPELLVATPLGRELYAALGWRTLSPYATAALPTAGD